MSLPWTELEPPNTVSVVPLFSSQQPSTLPVPELPVLVGATDPATDAEATEFKHALEPLVGNTTALEAEVASKPARPPAFDPITPLYAPRPPPQEPPRSPSARISTSGAPAPECAQNRSICREGPDPTQEAPLTFRHET